MKKFYLLSFVLATLCMTACNRIELECERGNGDLVFESFDIPSFESIHLDIAADVFLTQGPFETVGIEAQQNVLDLIELNYRSGTLEIDSRRCIQKREKISIFISIPQIVSLSINGAGNIYGQNDFTGDEFFLEIDGNGDMDLGFVNANIVSSFVDGSGNFNLDGNCNRLNADIDGTGDIRAFNLESSEAEVDINGAGKAEVFARDFLRVFIDGRGEVFFKGNPSIFESVDGRGGVFNAN